MVIDQFEEMLRLSETQPLVCGISFHTFVVGQPFRLRMLRRLLMHIVEHPQAERIWFTRPTDIADHIEALPPGTVLYSGASIVSPGPGSDATSITKSALIDPNTTIIVNRSVSIGRRKITAANQFGRQPNTVFRIFISYRLDERAVLMSLPR